MAGINFAVPAGLGGLQFDPSGWVSGLQQAGTALKSFAGTVQGGGARLASFGAKVAPVYSAAMKVAKAVMVVGVVIAAVASIITIKAVKAFAEFQQSLREIASLLPGATTQAFRDFGDAIKKISIDMGVTISGAVAAAYDLVSAGYSLNEALVIISESAIAAIAGLTDISVASHVAVSVMQAYGLGIESVRDVFDTLFMTVKLGRLRFEDLQKELGNVLPMANAAGVSIRELTGMVSFLTLKGMATNEAVTAMNRLLTQLYAPTKELKKRMEELGVVTLDTFGQPLPILEVLNQMIGMTPRQIRLITGEMRAAKAAFGLTSDMEKLLKHLETYGDRGGATLEAQAKQVDTLRFQWGQLAAESKSFWIGLGEQLAPIGVSVLKWFRSIISDATDWVARNRSMITNFVEMAVAKIDKLFGFLVGAGKDLIANFDFYEAINTLKVLYGTIQAIVTAMVIAAAAVGSFAGVVAIATGLILRMHGAFLSLIPGMDGVAAKYNKMGDELIGMGKSLTSLSSNLVTVTAGFHDMATNAIADTRELRKELAKTYKEADAAEAKRRDAEEERIRKHRQGPIEEAGPLPYSPEEDAKWLETLKERLRSFGVSEETMTKLVGEALEERTRLRRHHIQLAGKEYERLTEMQRLGNEADIMEIEERGTRARKEIGKSNEIITKLITRRKNLMASPGGGPEREEQLQALDSLITEELRKRFAQSENLLEIEKELVDKKEQIDKSANDRKEKRYRESYQNTREDAQKSADEEIKITDDAEREKTAALEKAKKEREKLRDEALASYRSQRDEIISTFKDVLREYKAIEKEMAQLQNDKRMRQISHEDEMFEYGVGRMQKEEALRARADKVRELRAQASGIKDVKVKQETYERVKDQLRQMLRDTDAMQRDAESERSRLGEKIMKGEASDKERDRFRDLGGDIEKAKSGRVSILKAMNDVHKDGIAVIDAQWKEAQTRYKEVVSQVNSFYDKLNELAAWVQNPDNALILQTNIPELLANVREISAVFREGLVTGKVDTPPIKTVGMQHGGPVGRMGTTDTVPAMLTPGEYVLARTDRYRLENLLSSIVPGASRSSDVISSAISGMSKVGEITHMTGNFNMPNVNRITPDVIQAQIVPELDRMRRRRIGR